ncbi:MAG: SPW repeat protein [Hyphomicrobiaceae bacterium]
MTTWYEKLSNQWKDAGSLALGIWLILSPWALAYAGETTAAWNAYIVGAIIAVAAFAALIAFQKWEEWVNAGLAAWLIVSPFVLGFSGLTYALWNQIIVGLLVGALAIWAAMATSHSGVTAKS